MSGHVGKIKAGVISSAMTELLHSPVEIHSTQEREKEWERPEKKGQRIERESLNGTGASSPHPYCRCLQSEECCISWGQCRGQGRRGSLLLRSPCSKHRAGLQTRRACGRQKPRRTDRERETDGQIETQMSCSIQCDASSVQCSPQIFSFAPSEDRSGNESFSHPRKNVPTDFIFMAWLFFDCSVIGWVCLFAVVPSTASTYLT